MCFFMIIFTILPSVFADDNKMDCVGHNCLQEISQSALDAKKHDFENTLCLLLFGICLMLFGLFVELHYLTRGMRRIPRRYANYGPPSLQQI
ncbi:unnamed protein product [Caenorhabditis angaria]|uniref:Uncharacterized protein n=1 Tax=Caenorhabditis angaria TaxID=860376 RepID=A0A9P1J022_9PELO|nr:unnamed protein product [Caenorhabditis angaria]